MTNMDSDTIRKIPESVRQNMTNALRREREVAEDANIFRLERGVLENGHAFFSGEGVTISVWRSDDRQVRIEIGSTALAFGAPVIDRKGRRLLDTISTAFVDLRGMYSQAILDLDF